MNDRRPPERDGSKRTISRRRALGAAALTLGGTGALLASVVPVRARTTDFGDVPVGGSRTREISTENPVSRSVEVTDLAIRGADSEAFDVVGGDAPFTLGPSESHTARIEFAPTSAGGKSASVRVETASRLLTAGQLAGTAVEEGAASASGEEGTGSDDAETSEEGDGETSAEESGETDSNGTDSEEDSSSTSTETDESDEDSSDGESSEASEESSPERSTTVDPAGTSAPDDSETGEPSATDPDAGDASGDRSDDAGTLLSEVLDVNDDGVVNLRDFLSIIRRFG